MKLFKKLQVSLLVLALYGCAEPPTAEEVTRELHVEACMAKADKHKIERAQAECLDKGVSFSACDKQEEIKAEHHEALERCLQ